MRIIVLLLLSVFVVTGQNSVLYDRTDQTFLQTNLLSSNIFVGTNMVLVKGAKGRLTLSATGGGGAVGITNIQSADGIALGTNGGIIYITNLIAYITNSFQPASLGLTNWSQIDTNALTTKLDSNVWQISWGALDTNALTPKLDSNWWYNAFGTLMLNTFTTNLNTNFNTLDGSFTDISNTNQVMATFSSAATNTFLLLNNYGQEGTAALILRNTNGGWRVAAQGTTNRLLFQEEGINTKGGFIADPFSGLFFIGDTTSDVLFKEISDGNLTIFRHDQNQYANLTASNVLAAGQVSITNGGLVIRNFNAASNSVWTCTNTVTGEGEWRVPGASGETNFNGEISATNATVQGWVYGKSGNTNLLRSFRGGNGILTTNESTNIVAAIDPAVVASQANLTAASNVLRTDITNLQGATNGLDALVRTKQNGSAALTNIAGLSDTTFTNVPLGGTNISVRTTGGTNFFDTTGQLNNWAQLSTNAIGSGATNAAVALLTNKIDNQAGFGTNTTLYASTNRASTTANVPLTIQGVVGSAQRLLQVSETNGTSLAYIKSNGVLRVSSGSSTDNAIGPTSNDGTGLNFPNSSTMDVALAGTTLVRFDSRLELGTATLAWGSSVSAQDVVFTRGGAGLLRLSQPSLPVTNRVYGLLSATNDNFLESGFDTSLNTFFLRANTNNTGTAIATNKSLTLGVGTNRDIFIDTNHSVWITSSLTNSASATNAVPETVVGGTGQMTNLVEWQGPQGTILGAVKSNATVMLPAGTASLPAIGWLADDDGSGTGLFRVNANIFGVSFNGTEGVRFQSDGILLGSGISIGFGGTSSRNTQVITDGGGVVRWENTTVTTPMTNRVVGTRVASVNQSSPTNAEWMEFGYDGAQSWFFLRSQKGSSNGTARPLVLSANGIANDLQINTNHSVTVPNNLTNLATVYTPAVVAGTLTATNGMQAASVFLSTNSSGQGMWRPFLNAGETYTTYWVPNSRTVPNSGSGNVTNSGFGSRLGSAGIIRNVLATTAGGPWFSQETSTTVNDTSFMNCNDSNYAPSGGGHNNYWKCVVQPLSTNNCRIFVGMQSVASTLFYTNSLSSGAVQCVLRYDSTTGDNDWVAIIGNGIGLPTTNKTGVVVSEGSTYICEGIADDTVPNFTFRINGVATTMTGTNVPNTIATLMSASCSINTTNGVAKTNRFRGWYDTFYY